MLKGLDPPLTSDLLHVLAQMGHGPLSPCVCTPHRIALADTELAREPRHPQVRPRDEAL